MNRRNPKVDGFLRKARQWREEFAALREIILELPLEEDMKWRWPCYAAGGRNVVLMHGFNQHCALLFFKGALMKDPKGLLVKPGENTQGSRQIRFTRLQDVLKLKSALKAYIGEAIELEKSGAKLELKKTSDFAIPAEFQKKLDEISGLKAAFDGLTPGRQRAYILHIASAKQSKTRESRVAKCLPRILKGKGLDD
jgi:uncharacterized protein YdeI (YjbR/CyaY-like superfamily)